ncbi:hypothetical protein NG798_04880 [Ancylothrix sp. C2]|uniref:hypothetical protein n=1 Tax=Ancylothrix sp. D3o TaxID=2953691 RepID=UPI0021BAAAEE|nr:hypothetical protein [Ancylothrix sp. D3o]MCT7949113.1 hypothetical protein [Ancylothrix sp. D3o]
MYNFAGFSVVFGILILLVYAILQWLHIPAGNFLDWVIGAATFEWLLLIVTVPWNIHFESKSVLAEAAESREKNIPVDENQISYVKTLANRSFLVAIALHLLSAIALYTLALTGISTVGYISSAAALLLTILRPAIRAYKYLAMRLTMIRSQFLYPREDIVELRSRFNELELKVTQIEEKLNPEYPTSWVASQQRQWEATQTELSRLAAALENHRSTNQAEHIQLAREAQNAIAQLSTDGQFLNHAREIIRFFKEA